MIDLIKQTNVIPRSPTTELRLYCGVPWDDKYEHVRLFNNTQDLLNNLDNWRVYPSNSERLMEMSPIKVGSLTLRVPFTEMEALELNYLAFCNHGISETWVFCFINSIEWLSENSTRINFSLDIFQNNFYKCNIKPCFIEYHHIPRSEDEIGANLLPVSIETGESICVNQINEQFLPDYICLYVTEVKSGAGYRAAIGKVVNNIYIGAELISSTGPSTINDTIENYNKDGKNDAIVSMFMSPKECVDSYEDGNAIEISKQYDIPYDNFFEGYKPKNNKLYTYPFCYLLVDNNEGMGGVFYYELFNSNRVEFNYFCCLATSPAITLLPINYETSIVGYKESLTIANFPLCAFNSDVYRAWLAQNRSSLALSNQIAKVETATGAVHAIAGIGNMAVGGAAMYGSAGAVGGSFISGGSEKLSQGLNQAKSGLYTLMSLQAQKRDKQVIPNTINGKVMSQNTNTAMRITGFTLYHMSCKKQFAKKADDFFTMYGYPINEIAMPNLNSRSTWNYVKTVGCDFTGCIDLNQLKELRAIFDRGVTLWHTNDIGNYSLENN